MRLLFMPKPKTRLRLSRSVTVLATIAELVSAEHSVAQTIAYTVVELGVADAGQVSCRINNLGDLVGRSGNSGAGGNRATIWSHGTLKPTHLGVLPGGEYSSASAINDAGEVAGASNTPNSIVPFIWNVTGGLQRVSLLPGDNCG